VVLVAKAPALVWDVRRSGRGVLLKVAKKSSEAAVQQVVSRG
jgi:hypothetical protein